MSEPKVDEVLFAYIVVASHAVSLVLRQVDSGVQRPIYYMTSHCMKQKFVTYHLRMPFWQ